MIRKPAVAGMFYEADFSRLNQQIKECFFSEMGPGELPEKEREGTIKAAIIPHAGYSYSGPAAAHAYKALAEVKFPDTFILIGPNHSGMGYDSVLTKDMRTPFGDVQIDMELAKEIINNTALVNDDMAHLREHSLEVHIPFLQFTAGDKLKELKIVPIVIGRPNVRKLASDLKDIVKGKNVCIIVSSDFIHHGNNFSYTPFKDRIGKNIREADEKAYDFIRRKDSNGFLSFIDDTGATICGMYAIAILLNVLDEEEADLLCHYNSGDITGDYSHCVDYMSIIFKK